MSLDGPEAVVGRCHGATLTVTDDAEEEGDAYREVAHGPVVGITDPFPVTLDLPRLAR
jgi:hypothetical protein